MLGEKGYTDCVAKSLCYQVLPGIFDFIQSEGEQKDSIVIVVSPLNALIRDQLQKLKDCVNVCVLQSIVEDDYYYGQLKCIYLLIYTRYMQVIFWSQIRRQSKTPSSKYYTGEVLPKHRSEKWRQKFPAVKAVHYCA